MSASCRRTHTDSASADEESTVASRDVNVAAPLDFGGLGEGPILV